MTEQVSERVWKNRSRRGRAHSVHNLPHEDPSASRIASHRFLISTNSAVLYVSILSIVVDHGSTCSCLANKNHNNYHS